MTVEKITSALFSALFVLGASAVSEDWRFVAAEQGATNLVIASAAPGSPLEFSWRWDPHEDPNVAKDAEAFGNIDECKIVDGGRTVLACASNGGAAAIDVASCRARWYLKLAPDTAGPHSLEILPDGRVAVACSVGIDKLIFVDVAKHPFEPSKQTVKEVMDLPGGHGVVWDAKRDSLFVLGYTNLFEMAYRKDSMSAVVKRRWEFSQAAVDAHGHDLVADGRGGYYMTNRTGVWGFNPDEGVFKPVMMRAHVKSYSPDGEKGILLQIPTEKWWSDRLIVITPDGGERIIGPFKGAKFYKARWIKENLKKGN